MRILMVSQFAPYLPCYDGFRLIPANLIRELRRRHEVHLLSPSDGTETSSQLQWPFAYCRSVTSVRTAARGRRLAEHLLRRGNQDGGDLAGVARALIRRLRPDVVHLEGAALAPMAKLVREAFRIPTLLSAHDSLSLRYREFARFGRAGTFQVRAWRAERFERRWFRFADRVVVTSRFDLEAIAPAVGGERIWVVPNGVDLDYYCYRPRPKPGRVIFTGNLSWLPNEDAATFFASEVFPRVQRGFADAEFRIAGAQPSQKVMKLAGIPGVGVTATPPDLRGMIRGASVYVSPLRFGMGVKNKILEAMALGPAIVATPESLCGTPMENGRHLLIAQNAEEIAQAVLRILNDPALGQSLSRQARREVERRYSWELAARRFEDLYAAVPSAAAGAHLS
jgi:glycosyltransferase involved in cell wall biosynthesis